MGHTYIHTCIHIYTYVLTYIHKYIHIYIHVCLQARMYVFIQTGTSTYILTQVAKCLCFKTVSLCVIPACKWLTLPALPPGAISQNIYCTISRDCYRIDCCTDLHFKALNFTKAMRMWFELDICKYAINIGVDSWQKQELIFNYKWGTESTVHIGKAIQIR